MNCTLTKREIDLWQLRQCDHFVGELDAAYPGNEDPGLGELRSPLSWTS